MMNKNRIKLFTHMKSKEILRVLEDALLFEEEIICWRTYGEDKLTARLKIIALKLSTNSFILSCHDDDLDKFVQIISCTQSINLFCQKDMKFLRTNIIEVLGKNFLLLQIPALMAQVDRREGLRLYTAGEFKSEVRFHKEVVINQKSKDLYFNKSTYDIGFGGMSLIVNRSEQRFFCKGDCIHEVAWFFGQEVFCFDLIVQNTALLSPFEQSRLNYRGWKIGMKFTNASSSTREQINYLIFKRTKIEL